MMETALPHTKQQQQQVGQHNLALQAQLLQQQSQMQQQALLGTVCPAQAAARVAVSRLQQLGTKQAGALESALQHPVAPAVPAVAAAARSCQTGHQQHVLAAELLRLLTMP